MTDEKKQKKSWTKIEEDMTVQREPKSYQWDDGDTTTYITVRRNNNQKDPWAELVCRKKTVEQAAKLELKKGDKIHVRGIIIKTREQNDGHDMKIGVDEITISPSASSTNNNQQNKSEDGFASGNGPSF